MLSRIATPKARDRPILPLVRIAGASLTLLLVGVPQSLSAMPAATSAPSAALVVRDPFNGIVGTIVAREQDFLILRTDRFLIKLPATAFTPTAEGYMIAMSRNEVNAAAHETIESIADLVSVGAEVRDRDGAAVGKVAAIDGDLVTLEVGRRNVRIARGAFAFDGTGLAVPLTKAELNAAAAR
jgi:hypothetical protein